MDFNLTNRNWRDRGGGFRQPQAAPVAQAPADTGMRPVGFRSGASDPGGVAHQAEAATHTASLGEPSSFRGGEGAPPPVEVVRGMRTTYTNPAPDSGPGGGYNPSAARNTAEFATPVAAQQAWNRGMRSEAVAAGNRRGFTTPEATLDTQYGGFRSPGQTLAETTGQKHVEAMAAYNRDPAKVAAAEIAQQKQAEAEKAKIGTDFETDVKRRHGEPTVGKGGGISYDISKLDPYKLRDIDGAKNYAMEQGDTKAGHNYMEWSQRLRMQYPDIYAATRSNPLAWDDVVRTHGPQLPAATSAPQTGAGAPGAWKPWWQKPAQPPAEANMVSSGQTPFTVGP